MQPFSTLLTANSGNGTVQLNENNFSFLTQAQFAPQLLAKSVTVAQTGTPAWLSIGVTVTNSINFVSFDSQFTSAAGAAGLLTVYWNTNLIGSMDETVALPGMHSRTFMLPGIFSDGNYALNFRLDPFTNVASSVTVTNVSLGYAGLTNPIVLSAMSTIAVNPRMNITVNQKPSPNNTTEPSSKRCTVTRTSFS